MDTYFQLLEDYLISKSIVKSMPESSIASWHRLRMNYLEELLKGGEFDDEKTNNK